ncbi:Hypothetical protein SCF082_LOCUS40039 [Durusdinium trenchii]|uniref:Uncharacterized protein n=1 Tax=Durusdinium trenchii TaxID=1381693 RepID=A0ABP0QA59_9DINO
MGKGPKNIVPCLSASNVTLEAAVEEEIGRWEADWTCDAAAALWGETCEDNSCTNAAVENLEQQELAEVKMELLQTSMFVGKLDRKTEEFYAPYWCYTVPEYSRASIAACNGGAGSCICMGPTVCGSWGPFPAGTWQSYSYSCCGCVPAPAPAAAVVPAPAVAAPVAAPAVAPAATATAAGGGGGGATASCSAHKGCQDLKLEGVCCPAADGTYLGCCDVSALETKVELTVDTKVVGKLSQLHAADASEFDLSFVDKLSSAHPAVLRRAFSLESRGTLPPHEDPLEQLLGAPRAPGGSWYASCVLQRSRRALSEFLSQALPKGVPHFLQRSPKSLASRCRPPTHSAAAWVFFGRNARGRVLRGRPEHTDAIQHSGTWHVQLKGQKVWTVRPTTELQRQARALKGAGPVKIRCKEGDVLCINTKLWWHQTHIPSKCQLSMSVARDMYLDGTRPGACDMTNVEGHYAVQAIRKGAVIFTEDDAPDLQLPRSSEANCELRESQDGRLVVAAKRAIRKGEWFSVSESEEEAETEERAHKRRR